MSNHSELRNLRSEGIHLKNKYKFIVLKITLMPQIKEALVGSNVNTKSTLQYPFQFCSDLFCSDLICRHNTFKTLATFIFVYFIKIRFNVYVHSAVIIGICSS